VSARQGLRGPRARRSTVPAQGPVAVVAAQAGRAAPELRSARAVLPVRLARGALGGGSIEFHGHSARARVRRGRQGGRNWTARVAGTV